MLDESFYKALTVFELTTIVEQSKSKITSKQMKIQKHLEKIKDLEKQNEIIEKILEARKTNNRDE